MEVYTKFSANILCDVNDAGHIYQRFIPFSSLNYSVLSI